MNKSDLLIPSWVDHEMQNWARWSLSAEYPGCPDWPGPRMARDLISRFYRAPDWGDDVRPLPPNEAHAQRVEQVVQKRMQPLERRIVDAEYLHPWDSGRWSYGRTGAALRLKRSYVTLVLRLSRRWVNEICAGDYRFDGRVPWARFQNERDCEICCRESSFL